MQMILCNIILMFMCLTRPYLLFELQLCEKIWWSHLFTAQQTNFSKASLNLLHSERQKLHEVLAVLSAKGWSNLSNLQSETTRNLRIQTFKKCFSPALSCFKIHRIGGKQFRSRWGSSWWAASSGSTLCMLWAKFKSFHVWHFW